jgi:hypothetical protein
MTSPEHQHGLSSHDERSGIEAEDNWYQTYDVTEPERNGTEIENKGENNDAFCMRVSSWTTHSSLRLHTISY